MSLRHAAGIVFGIGALLSAAACGKHGAPAAGANPTPIHAEGADARNIKLYKEPPALADFSLTTLDGKHISSADLKGKVVLMNFWATWCPPCRAEIPDLMEIQARYGDKVVIIGISEDDPPVDVVTKFVANQKMNYPVAMSTPELRKIFKGVVALPTTFVIDQNGKLEQKHVGQLDAANAEAEARFLAGIDVKTVVERVDSNDKVRLANAAQAKAIPGIDLTHLTEAQHKKVVDALISQDCTCGCESTVAECRLDDPTCPVSLPLAQEIVKKYAAQN